MCNCKRAQGHHKRLSAIALIRYQQGEEKDSDTENDKENGLRMKNVMTMKEKRFSFFADPQEKKAVSRPTFGTLHFAQYTSKRFAKFKEPNLANSLGTEQSI